MKTNYKLLHKSNNTLLKTPLPVYFYGLPNGNIHAIYARFYEVNFSKSGLEFVFARLGNLFYDFDSGKIVSLNDKEVSLPRFKDLVENKELNIKKIKSYRNITSFKDAVLLLEHKIRKQEKVI